MIKKYYEDYYRGKIKVKDICNKENISIYYFKKELSKNELKPYMCYFDYINIGTNDLNKILRKKS